MRVSVYFITFKPYNSIKRLTVVFHYFIVSICYFVLLFSVRNLIFFSHIWRRQHTKKNKCVFFTLKICSFINMTWMKWEHHKISSTSQSSGSVNAFHMSVLMRFCSFLAIYFIHSDRLNASQRFRWRLKWAHFSTLSQKKVHVIFFPQNFQHDIVSR